MRSLELQESHTEKLREQIKQRDKMVAYQGTEIASLKATIKERNRRIAFLTKFVDDCNAVIDSQIEQLRNLLDKNTTLKFNKERSKDEIEELRAKNDLLISMITGEIK